MATDAFLTFDGNLTEDEIEKAEEIFESCKNLYYEAEALLSIYTVDEETYNDYAEHLGEGYVSKNIHIYEDTTLDLEEKAQFLNSFLEEIEEQIERKGVIT